MSFVSIIKAIGKDALKVLGVGLTVETAVEAAVEPVLIVLDPAAAAILAKVQVVVGSLEQMVTTAQQGTAKAESAVQILQQEIPALQAVITATGSGYQLPTAQAQALVNDAVQLYNTLNTVIQGFKPPPPAPAAKNP